MLKIVSNFSTKNINNEKKNLIKGRKETKSRTETIDYKNIVFLLNSIKNRKNIYILLLQHSILVPNCFQKVTLIFLRSNIFLRIESISERIVGEILPVHRGNFFQERGTSLSSCCPFMAFQPVHCKSFTVKATISNYIITLLTKKCSTWLILNLLLY